MPNNFKLTGDYYVSKAGSDSNDGLTPETPLLTVQAALDKITTGVNRRIIIGSGVYREAVFKSTPNATFTISLVADGYVVFEGNAGTDFNINCSSGNSIPTIYLIGVEIRGYNSFTISGGLGGSGIFYFVKCVFKNNILFSVANAFSWSPQFYFDSTIFINCTTRFSSNAIFLVLSYDKCVFINSSFDYWELVSTGGLSFYNQINVFRNNYVDQNSLIRFRARSFSANGILLDSFLSPGATINNNIQGKVVFPWTGSVSGISTFNVPISYAQAKIDYPTYFFNSVSADPKFNNPRLLDFTLQSGSPNVTASSDYVSNIGGTEYAVPFTASSAAFTTNATSQSLEYRGLYYSISGSAVSGSITSGPMFLQWPRTKPMTSINWIGALEFNKTITASLAGNNNVPAYTTFTSASGAQGANPDRLKIRMRFSTQQTQPATDVEWDNNGYWPAGTYQLFEPNTKPKVDYKGTGNGDPTYVETSAIGDLVPSWVQTEIILRNDYNR